MSVAMGLARYNQLPWDMFLPSSLGAVAPAAVPEYCPQQASSITKLFLTGKMKRFLIRKNRTRSVKMKQRRRRNSVLESHCGKQKKVWIPSCTWK